MTTNQNGVVADSAAVAQTSAILRLVARRLEAGDLAVIPSAIALIDKVADELEFMSDALETHGRIIRGKVES
jgi:hypothetical protein